MADKDKSNFYGYDLPQSQGQVHLHNDCAYGRVYDYSYSVYGPLNAYEAAMADYYAQNVGLKRFDPKK